MDILEIPEEKQSKFRRLIHPKEELDVLFEAIETAAKNDGPIDFEKAGFILCPGDIVWVGAGDMAGDMIFEIPFLNWLYKGDRYRAWITPRPHHAGLPVIEWVVPVTVCETGRYAGKIWNRTDMLRPENRLYGDDADSPSQEAT